MVLGFAVKADGKRLRVPVRAELTALLGFTRLRQTYGTQPASQMGRFETEILTQPQNPKALMNQPGQWVDIHEIS